MYSELYFYGRGRTSSCRRHIFIHQHEYTLAQNSVPEGQRLSIQGLEQMSWGVRSTLAMRSNINNSQCLRKEKTDKMQQCCKRY